MDLTFQEAMCSSLSIFSSPTLISMVNWMSSCKEGVRNEQLLPTSYQLSADYRKMGMVLNRRSTYITGHSIRCNVVGPVTAKTRDADSVWNNSKGNSK